MGGCGTSFAESMESSEQEDWVDASLYNGQGRFNGRGKFTSYSKQDAVKQSVSVRTRPSRLLERKDLDGPVFRELDRLYSLSNLDKVKRTDSSTFHIPREFLPYSAYRLINNSRAEDGGYEIYAKSDAAARHAQSYLTEFIRQFAGHSLKRIMAAKNKAYSNCQDDLLAKNPKGLLRDHFNATELVVDWIRNIPHSGLGYRRSKADLKLKPVKPAVKKHVNHFWGLFERLTHLKLLMTMLAAPLPIPDSSSSSSDGGSDGRPNSSGNGFAYSAYPAGGSGRGGGSQPPSNPRGSGGNKPSAGLGGSNISGSSGGGLVMEMAQPADFDF